MIKIKKYLTLEIFIDDKISDAKECADEIISDMTSHYFVCDGTVKVNVIKDNN